MKKQIKYPQITEYCKKCAGCNKLEDFNFRGVYSCKDYLELTNLNEKETKKAWTIR